MKFDNDLISAPLVQNVFAVHRFAQGGDNGPPPRVVVAADAAV